MPVHHAADEVIDVSESHLLHQATSHAAAVATAAVNVVITGLVQAIYGADEALTVENVDAPGVLLHTQIALGLRANIEDGGILVSRQSLFPFCLC